MIVNPIGKYYNIRLLDQLLILDKITISQSCGLHKLHASNTIVASVILLLCHTGKPGST